MPETMRLVWEAVLGLWTILSCILLQYEWHKNKGLQHLIRTEKTNAKLYLEKWLEGHKEKMAIEAALAQAKEELVKLQADYDNLQEFNEVTCAGPQPFGQQSAAFDPKIPNEVYEGESVRKQGEQ